MNYNDDIIILKSYYFALGFILLDVKYYGNLRNLRNVREKNIVTIIGSNSIKYINVAESINYYA